MQKTAIDIHTSYLYNIIYNYKNDLVSGNYRIFRTQISTLIEKEVFSDYAIIQNGVILDKSDNFDKRKNDLAFSQIAISVNFDELNQNKWGDVILLVNDRPKIEFKDLILSRIGRIITMGISFLVFMSVIYLLIWQKLNLSLTDGINKIFSNKKTNLKLKGINAIWNPILTQIQFLKNDYELLLEQKKTNEKNEILFQVSRQVSHDIRSPIAAINMIANDFNVLPLESKQILDNSIERINNIADGLLKLAKAENNITIYKTNLSLSSCDLSIVLKDTIEEKKIIFKNDPSIIFDTTEIVHPIRHCLIDKTEIGRLLSNIINNSIEAKCLNKIHIKTKFLSEQNFTKIIIEDNGFGISQSIIEKIGKVKITTKDSIDSSGSGIGLLHANSILQALGGYLEIDSREGVGTSITLNFPNTQIPLEVILLDDDQLVHLYWKKAATTKNIHLYYFQESFKLYSYLNDHNTNKDIPIFLDLNLKNESGIDVAKKLFQLGFTNLHLTTGQIKENIIDIPLFIKTISNKEFPDIFN